jgi:hypothetical protein
MIKSDWVVPTIEARDALVVTHGDYMLGCECVVLTTGRLYRAIGSGRGPGIWHASTTVGQFAVDEMGEDVEETDSVLVLDATDGLVKRAAVSRLTALSGAGAHAACRVEWNGSTSEIRNGHGFVGGTQFGDGSVVYLELDEPIAPALRQVWLKCYLPASSGGVVHGLATEFHDPGDDAATQAAFVKFRLVRNNTENLYNYENYVYVRVDALETGDTIALVGG